MNDIGTGGRADPAAGYTVIHLPDGGRMIAMDSRLPSGGDSRAEAAEARGSAEPSNAAAWPSAVPLRLGQFITLRPGEARLRWEAAVSNPMPMRAPMVLDHWLRPPGKKAWAWLLPAERAVAAAGAGHEVAGWYVPDSGINCLRRVDGESALGLDVVRKGRAGEGHPAMLTTGVGGAQPTVNMLPAFGGYRMTIDLLPVAGIGRIDYATPQAAVNVERGPRGWVVRLWSAKRLTGGTLTVTGGRCERPIRRWRCAAGCLRRQLPAGFLSRPAALSAARSAGTHAARGPREQSTGHRLLRACARLAGGDGAVHGVCGVATARRSASSRCCIQCRRRWRWSGSGRCQGVSGRAIASSIATRRP